MKKVLSVKNIIYLNIIIVFLLGFIWHFLYEWTGWKFIGIIAPLNESVWEHSKLILFPLLIVNTIEYFIFKKKGLIDKEKYTTSVLLNVIVSILMLFMIYYTYTNALGVESMLVDILLLPISLLFGGLIQNHYYKYGKGWSKTIVCCVFVFIIFIYILFTFSPGDLPIFKVN